MDAIGMKHAIVVDLGFGDAGKGSTVDWLCSPAARSAAAGVRRDGRRGDDGSLYRAVIRFNGGAQAGHNVVTPDGRHHTFAQFGSGTFHGVPTHLSRFMLVEPFALAAEAAHLAELGVPRPFDLLSADSRALLTTPYHRAANRVREAARDRTPGATRHGSCGMGIGETVSFSLAVSPDKPPRVGDCRSRPTLIRKLTDLRDHLAADLELSGLRLPDGLPGPECCADVYRAFAQQVRIVDEERSGYLAAVLDSGPCVFEGAQGVLLDEWYGFHPHTTWSTTTFANADALLEESGLERDAALHLGVVRTYTTRHGAGPLVTEDAALTGGLPEPHNETGTWQGAFRIGHFDAVAHRYALDVSGGADALAVTHADAAADGRRLCWAYQASTDVPPMTKLPTSLLPDLDYQRLLTKTVSKSAPLYREGPEDPRAWPDVIGEALGTPVGLVSAGPTWQDKAVRLPCVS
ncbi:adenylosuccinate synthetase [Catenulispora subtropica]|uniref:Adenylosuccinate synthetase n=1 Tax=Catenulispora subtropica TaxID=450798 RepID=A0ABP5CGW9_9ACTN